MVGYVLKLWSQLANLKWLKCFIFIFLLFTFYNALDLNNQKSLCLHSAHNLSVWEETGFFNHSKVHKYPPTQSFIHFWWNLDPLPLLIANVIYGRSHSSRLGPPCLLRKSAVFLKECLHSRFTLQEFDFIT